MKTPKRAIRVASFSYILALLLSCLLSGWVTQLHANDASVFPLNKVPDSQEEEKAFVIGLAVWNSYPESVRGFKEELTERGLIEGENVSYLLRSSAGDSKKQREIAESFRLAEVDLVYSLTTPGTTIIKQIMPDTTPIVFSIVTYPADSGLIEAFDYSANNLVGTSNFVPYKYYLELLQEIMPTLQHIAIFHHRNEPNSKIQAVNMRRMLRRQGVKVSLSDPELLSDVRLMGESLVNEVDAFMTTTDTLMQNGGEKILIELSLAHGLPILSSNKGGIEAGSTFGPVADFYTLGRLSGRLAYEILAKNKTPSQLESSYQDPPHLLVNKKSLKRLGLTVPSHLDVVYVD